MLNFRQYIESTDFGGIPEICASIKANGYNLDDIGFQHIIDILEGMGNSLKADAIGYGLRVKGRVRIGTIGQGTYKEASAKRIARNIVETGMKGFVSLDNPDLIGLNWSPTVYIYIPYNKLIEMGLLPDRVEVGGHFCRVLVPYKDEVNEAAKSKHMGVGQYVDGKLNAKDLNYSARLNVNSNFYIFGETPQAFGSYQFYGDHIDQTVYPRLMDQLEGLINEGAAFNDGRNGVFIHNDIEIYSAMQDMLKRLKKAII